MLDETTSRNPEDVSQAAYGIAGGRTKGRLRGADYGYQAEVQSSYALVCFLSGERPRRHSLTP